jgi:DNA-binding transcriptional regulator YiaG
MPTSEQIRYTRTMAGLTTAQAAAIACVSQRAWQRWEDGTRDINAASWKLLQMHITAASSVPPCQSPD